MVHEMPLSGLQVLTYAPSREDAAKHAERLICRPMRLIDAGMVAEADITAKVRVVPTKTVRGWTPTSPRRTALALLLRRGFKGMASMNGFVLRRGRIRLMLVDPSPALLGPVLLRRLGQMSGLRPADLRAPEVLALPEAPDPVTLTAHARLQRVLRREHLRDARRREVVVFTRTIPGHPDAWVELDMRDRGGHLSAGFRLHHVAGNWYLSSFSGALWSIPPDADVLDVIRAQIRAGTGTIYAPSPKVEKAFGLRRAKHEAVFGPL